MLSEVDPSLETTNNSVGVITRYKYSKALLEDYVWVKELTELLSY